MLHQLLQICLYIIFCLTFNRKHSLAVFFAELLTVTDRYYIRFFEADCQEFEYYVLAVWQSELEMVLDAFGDHGHLPGLV